VLTGDGDTHSRSAEGDAVTAGATNLGARLLVRVRRCGRTHTRVGALLAIVQDALSRKAVPAGRPPTVLARRFVHVLLVVAALTAAVDLGPRRIPAEVAMQRVVALLVVSCPCALGLAVPLAMSVALTRAARAGIFVKNPDAFRAPATRRNGAARQDGHTHRRQSAAVARWHGDDVGV
jgi:cation transport ATPase